MSNKDAVQALIAHRTRFRDDFGWDTSTAEALDIAIASLAAESKPVVRGEWMDYADKWDLRRKRHDYRCPKCGNRADYFVCGTEDWWCAYEPNYCPNCGADMRKEEDNG